MRRTKEDAEITRKRILDAALNIFSSKGYARATLNDIAKAAGVTRGAIYWHFEGKSEIYSVLVEERLSGATQVIRNIFVENISPEDKIRKFLVTSMKYVEKDADYRAIMQLTLFKTEVIDEVEEMMEIKKEGTKKTISEIARIIEEGIAQGKFREDLNSQSVAIAVIGLINGMISLWMLNTDYFSMNQHIDNIADQFMRGLWS
ncbi:MAG: TetR family transcriptional regulator [Clostridia bacterium]